MIYNVGLISSVQQSDSVIYIYTFFFYFILFKNILLNTFKNFYLFYLFIFDCVESSLLHAGFLQLRRAGATLRCGAWASDRGGLSCCGARAPGSWASVVVARGLSSCGARA